MTVRHGTALGYSSDGCRCNRCRAAWRLYKREQNWSVGRYRPWDDYLATLSVTHGLRSSYKNGCRCADCTEAERLYKARYRSLRASRRGAGHPDG